VGGVTDRKQGGTGSSRADGRVWNALLVVIAAVCTFGGPYAVYVFSHLLKRSLLFSTVSGVGLFAVGMVLTGYLIKKKVIS
jgi:formate hydrogenlyase subunit 3/multisubunit Na+/H+ antiporter MnhD subunit